MLSLPDQLQSERQQRLREQARRLIAERTKSTKSNNSDSPSSPIKKISPDRPTISPISPQSMDAALVLNNNNKNLSNHNRSPSHPQDELGTENNRSNSSPARDRLINGESRNSPTLDKISPRSESKDQISYIQSELDALEREQESIDLKASALERKLRAVMGGNSGKLVLSGNEEFNY